MYSLFYWKCEDRLKEGCYSKHEFEQHPSLTDYIKFLFY